MSATSDYIRQDFGDGDTLRDKGLSTPPDVERFDNIVYGPDKEWNVLDVYRPKASKGKVLPVIVSVHGGGWVYGDKERYQFYCMDLARRGFAVVNFTYHLAPRFKFPQQLLDTTLAFQWVSDNAETYGLDTSNLFAVGDSAGGHLLALYCVLCTVPEYAAQFSFFAGSKALPSAVALNCGVYEVTNGSRMNNILMKDLLPRRAAAEDLHRVSPLLYLTSSFPPSFIATAVKDFLREDSLQLRDRLTALGVPNLYRLYDNEDHTLGHVFHLNIRSDKAKECNDEECSFFLEHLSKPDA